MQLAIISDIHANLQALEAVMEDARECGVEQFVCLGDIVGYGPQPSECVKIIRELNCPVVRGNHDQDASKDCDLSRVGPDARDAMIWTRNKLSTADRDWLGSLPYMRRVGRFAIAHATPRRANLFDYVKGLQQAEKYLKEQDISLCFIGHTHVPGFFEHTNGSTREITSGCCVLAEDSRYLCNVGSVGQPRDKDPRASYVIYDREIRVLERRRVDYDIAKTQSLIKENKLPINLANRLDTAI